MGIFSGKKKGAVPHTDTPLYQFQPGTKVQADSVLSWGFDMPTTLPVLLDRGPGRVAGSLNVFQSGPQLFSPLSIPTSGFGGTQTGKFVLSPLVDNSVSSTD